MMDRPEGVVRYNQCGVLAGVAIFIFFLPAYEEETLCGNTCLQYLVAKNNLSHFSVVVVLPDDYIVHGRWRLINMQLV